MGWNLTRFKKIWLMVMEKCYLSLLRWKFYSSLWICFPIMKQELAGLLNAPVVFAHNDLLCGNLMVNDEEGIYDFCWLQFYFCYYVLRLICLCYNIYVPNFIIHFKFSLTHTCMLTCGDTLLSPPSMLQIL